MPSWFARRVLDTAGKLTDLYYRLKYGAMARRLGRPTVLEDNRRGFILIQIDGLSHSHLREALAEGIMPYVNRQLTSGRLTAAPWRCGLPSSTPAVQAGLLFGNRFDIPGFRWYEKEHGTTVTPQRLDQVGTISERIGKEERGILTGGSCYVSIFDGDADLALFTLSTLRRQRFFESMRGVGLLMLFLLSPLRVLRFIGLTITDYGTRAARRVVGLWQPTRRWLGSLLRIWAPQQAEQRSISNPIDILSPLLHAVTDVLFTEVQTFGVMLDIYRRVPAIYANYNGYDEVAHEMGPNHPAAFRVLRRIDNRIHQIDRMRARYRKREYDLYLMSDHGNTPAVPFSWLNDNSLGQHLITVIDQRLSLDEHVEGHTYDHNRARYLREELRALEDSVSPRFRNFLATARHYIEQHVEDVGAWDYDIERQEDVIVSASGPLAHIYFNVCQRALDVMEVLLLYPKLVDQLTTTRGIEAVIGRAEERTIVLGRGGGTLEIDGVSHLVEPPNPLASLDDIDHAAQQIHRLAHFPHAGDIILLGEIHEDGRVTTFETQAATHGGLGGPQERPFIAWSPKRDLDPEMLQDAEDLYAYFKRYQGQADSTPIP